MLTQENKYRHEIKYRINSAAYFVIRQRLKAVMPQDAHVKNGVYRVTSLYFDDIYRSAYRDKVNGVMNRKKYRIRTYNGDKKFIRLEEKIKNDNVGYKKATPITYDEYQMLLRGEKKFLSEERFSEGAGADMFASDSAVLLSPAVIVDYIREPYVCRAGNVRITFDMKISACVNGYDLFDENNVFETVMPDNEIILEVKFDNFIPEYILSVLSGEDICRESVSKYVLCMDKYITRMTGTVI